MSEWLTTGQMIDQLQEGEIAECETGERVKIYPQVNLNNFHGIKSAICWIMTDGEPMEFYMSEGNRKVKWRIIPQYVTWQEAFEAAKNGKVIELHRGSGRWRYRINKDEGYDLQLWSIHQEKWTPQAVISFEKIFNGKWTIEN